MRMILAGVAVLTAVSVAAAPAAAAAAGPKTGLRGWARMDPHGPVAGQDRLTLALDARSRHRAGSEPGSTRARGHATIQHAFPNEDGTFSTNRIEIDVDCLVTENGRTTAVTGTVRSLTFIVPPGHEQPTARPDWHPDTAFSFSTDANGRQRVGWSIPPYNDPTAPPAATRCVAPLPAPTDFYLVEGGFTPRR
ncbi:hypothetical protein ACFVHB_07155 [Kitasatospora sp. NPDC127111]|uniref:hypothetical protein n=1 Tax=Kitasatospora sp. NPDC127111 TaxID=3345363 RepID=UPI003640EA8F